MCYFYKGKQEKICKWEQLKEKFAQNDLHLVPYNNIVDLGKLILFKISGSIPKQFFVIFLF